MNEDAWEKVVERIAHIGVHVQDHLTLTEGEKVNVVFLGDPWAYEAAWCVERKQWVPYLSPSPIGPTLRVRINVYIPEMDRLKWWEMDTPTFHGLWACRDKYGLDKWVFEIEAKSVSRDGSCGVYAILPEDTLGASDLARIACRPLFQWKEAAGQSPTPLEHAQAPAYKDLLYKRGGELFQTIVKELNELFPEERTKETRVQVCVALALAEAGNFKFPR